MQKPRHNVDLAKTAEEIRLTTGLDEPTQQEILVSVKAEQTTRQEFRVSTQTDMEAGLESGCGSGSDRMFDSLIDTQTGTSTQTESHTDTQSDTRHKTASGELSSLEKHHDPDGTMAGPDIFLVKTYAKVFDNLRMAIFTTLSYLAGAQ